MSAMIPDELFRKLQKIGSAIRGAESLFIPYVGPRYGQGMPKIMFVGQATRGLDAAENDLTIDNFAKASRRFVEEELKGRRFDRKSAFWRFVVSATLAMASRSTCETPTDDEAAWALDRIVWTNLMKIAVEGANPTGIAARKQRDICREILLYELKKLSPHCVIILTNEYEGDLVWDVFGNKWKRLGDPDLNSQTNIGGGIPAIYYTTHPQGKASDVLSRLTKAVIKDFSSRT